MKFMTIKKCPLFAGINDAELETLLNCLTAKHRVYEREEFIFMTGDAAESVGIVLSGAARVMREDFWGNRLILAHIEPGGMFGEAFSCAGIDRLPVSVAAAEKTEILLLDYRRITGICTSACVFHTRLIKNMLSLLAEKNIMLTNKIGHLAKRTIREKLLSFLSSEAAGEKGGIITVPFNRQELADYLCVDRSALSRELSVMRDEGLIRFDKNRFELLREET